MSQSGIEQRLDKLLEKVSGNLAGGAHTPLPSGRDVARVVKRTEVASTFQKMNMVKYVVIGIAIILLLVGAIYFVAKTKYGKGIRDMMGSWLPGGNKKKRKVTDLSRSDGPPSKLVAQEVDFRTKASPHGPPHGPPHGQPQYPQRPTVTVHVPRIPPPTKQEEEEEEELDPGAVRFKRRKGPVGGGPVGVQGPPLRPPRPQGPPPPVDDVPMPDTPGAQAANKPRGPSPPIDDSGPPTIIDASGYDNDQK